MNYILRKQLRLNNFTSIPWLFQGFFMRKKYKKKIKIVIDFAIMGRSIMKLTINCYINEMEVENKCIQ